jgi:NTP pyrophosphatase (non-canonical NTP hydrolase)
MQTGKDSELTLSALQHQVDTWIKTYGVRYFNELTNFAVLTEEVGELGRVMARKFGEQSFKEGEKENMEEELADILFVLTCIANQTGIDLNNAMHKTLEKKTNRDKERHKSNPKL